MFDRYEKELPVNKIDISKENVRKSQQEKGLEELKVSIQRVGLIQPVIVVEKAGNRYELIVGQRRLLAFQELGRSTIPALVIKKSLDEDTSLIVSFGENLHRRKLPYDDTIKVCDRLFKDYGGSRIDKINKIAKDLGINRQTVVRYLGYNLIPKRVREMVTANLLTASAAARITSAYWPNDDRIIDFAKLGTGLTNQELDRAIQYSEAHPKEKLETAIEEGKKPPKIVDIVVPVSTETAELLRSWARQKEMEIGEIARKAIETYLEEEGATVD